MALLDLDGKYILSRCPT